MMITDVALKKTTQLNKQEINGSTIDALVDRRIDAIVVNNFIDPNLLQEWTLCLNTLAYKPYKNASDVGISKLGGSLFEIKECPIRYKEYFQEAIAFNEVQRLIFKECQGPFSYLYQELQQIWPNGLEVLKLGGQECCPGVIRNILKANGIGLPPHRDTLLADTESLDVNMPAISCELAVNLYLDVPTEGGELKIWEDTDPSKDIFTGQHDFIEVNPETPVLTIKPKAGQLILFRSGSVHSVAPSVKGARIAVGCFIGVPTDKSQPLLGWA